MSHKPADALQRFMHGIYAHYHDKGIGSKKAKGRMIDETLQAVRGFIDKEEEIPDHMIVIAAQFFSEALNQRGKKLTESAKSDLDPQDPLLVALRQLKSAKVAVDQLITTYKGV